MTKVVVGATCAPYKTDDPRGILSWLANAEQLIAGSGAEVEFFAAVETDGRGLDPHEPLVTELADLGGSRWTFSIDDGAEEITSHGRLKRICAGRNLVADYAQDVHADYVLFADTDVAIPGDAILRLLEVDWPLVGGYVPTYCLDGPRARCWPAGDGHKAWETRWTVTGGQTIKRHDLRPFPDEADVRVHMNTAGFLLVRRDLFTRLRWRIDLDKGMTDDPCYHADATELGYPTWVRHDCVGAHWPACIGPLETRGHDLTVYRDELPVG